MGEADMAVIFCSSKKAGSHYNHLYIGILLFYSKGHGLAVDLAVLV